MKKCYGYGCELTDKCKRYKTDNDGSIDFDVFEPMFDWTTDSCFRIVRNTKLYEESIKNWEKVTGAVWDE